MTRVSRTAKGRKKPRVRLALLEDGWVTYVGERESRASTRAEIQLWNRWLRTDHALKEYQRALGRKLI